MAEYNLTKVQQQRDEAIKEVNRAMALRIKATRDLAKLTEERNAALQEYHLVMSERDSVHKEMEKLQESLSEVTKKCELLEEEKKAAQDEVLKMKRLLAAVHAEKERILRECYELREKYNDFSSLTEDSPSSIYSVSSRRHNYQISSPASSRSQPSSLLCHGALQSPTQSASMVAVAASLYGFTGMMSIPTSTMQPSVSCPSSGVSSLTSAQLSKSSSSDLLKGSSCPPPPHLSTSSSSSSVSTVGHHPSNKNSPLKFDTLEGANQEIEILRKQLEKLSKDLAESQNEAEISKKRRDWAINEKKKILLERESIRYLCDSLRKERNQRDRELSKALTDNDELKRQLAEALQALSEYQGERNSFAEKTDSSPPPPAPSGSGTAGSGSPHEAHSPQPTSPREPSLDPSQPAAAANSPNRPTACSRDSAIDAGLEELESELMEQLTLTSKERHVSGTGSPPELPIVPPPPLPVSPRTHRPPYSVPCSRPPSMAPPLDHLASVASDMMPVVVSATPVRKPLPGEVRDIIINKSSQPLGIRIACDEKDKGCIFVSCVSENSIAAQAGLQIGDQLLDINGINMRSRMNLQVATTVLHTTTSSNELKMRVQYNPEEFEHCFPNLSEYSLSYEMTIDSHPPHPTISSSARSSLHNYPLGTSSSSSSQRHHQQPSRSSISSRT